jgi:DeoR/GlpR family transcriptional regulator of sugar metabolism
MKLSERPAHIVEMVRQADFIRVDDHSRHVQVTTQTIRRDMNTLRERKFARRAHGALQRINTIGNVTWAWRQMIRQNHRDAYPVLDQTTFGRAAHGQGGKIDQATTIICNRTPPSAVLALSEPSGAQLIICNEDKTP